MTTPGSAVTPIQAGSFENAPAWLHVSSGYLSGVANLPSGYRRIVTVNSGVRSVTGITVDPVALPADTISPWRCVIYTPHGSYIIMNGLKGIPTVGTPVVRLSDNAPSKAVVRIPLAKGRDNVRSPLFDKWSDGLAGMIKRGMEMTVEYRDTDTGALTMVFRGRIFQISSGETVEIVAYDRLMDLAQFSDQYQPELGEEDTQTSSSRTTSGSDYIYQLGSEVGTITGVTEIDKIKYDSLSSLTVIVGEGSGSILQRVPEIAHSIPYAGTIALAQDDRVTRVGMKYRNLFGSSSTFSVTARFRLYYADHTVVQQAVATATASGNQFHEIYADVDWILDSAPSDYLIGVELSGSVNGLYIGGTNSPHYTSYSHYYNGSWQNGPGTGGYGEVYVEASRHGASLDPNAFTASGTTVRTATSTLQPPTAMGTMSVLDAGAQVSVQFYPVGGVSVRSLLIALLSSAGMDPQVINEDLGQLTYYTTSTYDYLTCIHELMRAENLGVKDSVTNPGTVLVRRRHTVDEAPVRTVTTDPVGTGDRIILDHDLTAHWQAERATVAYITGGMQGSMTSYPIALETDDGLMDDSLVEALGTPLRQMITDTSMGSHDMMAKAAGGKMVQLHTNVVEGNVTLAGYRVSLWDIYGSGEGGVPLSLDIPEYDAQCTAVPTEMVLENGVTRLTLNNIRTADRSEVANSMGLTADAISNSSTILPSAVFVFSRVDPRCYSTGIPGNVTAVEILDGAGVVMASQTDPNFIKRAEDNAGYDHVCALFTPIPGTPYAPRPIASVKITVQSQANIYIYATVTNPKAVTALQGIHVDVRVKKV